MSLRSLKTIAFAILRRVAAMRYRLTSNGRLGNCILVLQYMLPLGGCVHATPLFEALHEGLPQLPVYVVTRGIGLEVLRHDPDIAGLITTSDVFSDLGVAVEELKRALNVRSLRPAWVVSDAGNRRSRIAFLGALASGAPMVGFSLAEGLEAIGLKRDARRSMIEENLQIAGALGTDAAAREPRMYCSAEEAAEAKGLLETVNPMAKPIVVFSTQPSGGQPTAWWPERWVPVIEWVVEQGMLPVFVGTESQTAAIDLIRSQCVGATATVAGKTRVCVLAALLAQADLCISIDTGTLHVARAVDVPCVALAPTFQNSLEWLPMHWPKARVLRGEGIRPAGPEYHLDEIEPDQVVLAAEELLRHYPATVSARAERILRMTTDVDHLAS